MDFESFVSEIGFIRYPEKLKGYYERAVAADGALLDGDYIKTIIDKYSLFKDEITVEILENAKKIRDSELYTVYTKLLNLLLSEEATAGVIIPEPEADKPERNFAPLISMLPLIENSMKEFKAHNIPDEMVHHANISYESGLRSVKAKVGFYAYNQLYFNYLRRYLGGNILKIDKLGFEKRTFDVNAFVFKNIASGEYTVLMNNINVHRDGYPLGCAGYKDKEGAFIAEFRETDKYYEGYKVLPDARIDSCKTKLSKKEYIKVLSPTDNVLAIHISEGTPIDEKSMLDNYELAMRFYAEHYPEFDYHAICAYSWLMDPKLQQILKPTSNIRSLQNYYISIPAVSGGRDVFTFIFKKPFKDYSELPENTSLERALKKLYLDGKCIFSNIGVHICEKN